MSNELMEELLKLNKVHREIFRGLLVNYDCCQSQCSFDPRCQNYRSVFKVLADWVTAFDELNNKLMKDARQTSNELV